MKYSHRFNLIDFVRGLYNLRKPPALGNNAAVRNSRALRNFLIIVLIMFLGACSSDENGDNIDSPFGLEKRAANGACVAPPPPDSVGLGSEDLFNTATFSGVDDMQRAPDGFFTWLGIQQGGKVLALVDNSPIGEQEVININDLTAFVTSTNSELGLLSMAIEPDYNNPQASLSSNQFRLYLYYTSNGCYGMGSNLCSRVSRFVISQSINGDYSAGTEEVLMEFRQYNALQNGGALRFGPDQLLYISSGDGGGYDDPSCAGQNLASPLGKLLRIDVNTSSGYRVPAANPFSANTKCDQHGGIGSSGRPDNSRFGDFCPEVVAYGLHNPTHISVDTDKGYLWIGDEGQDAVEEVNKFAINSTILRNFAWPLREGPDVKSNSACNSVPIAPAAYQDYVPTQFSDPVFYARHANNSARGKIVSGAVYRGAALGSYYYGSYFFADAKSGEHWIQADPYQSNMVDVSSQTVNYFPGQQTLAFSEDDNDELVMLINNGAPQRVIRQVGTSTNFPQSLSQTGCFSPSNPTQPVNSMIHYDVISPLWSDGSLKRRYLSIPDGSKISMDAQGKFIMPVGSLLFKEFRAPDGTLLETRMLVKHNAQSWGAYAYAWNAAKTDAELVGASGLYLPDYNWFIPSQSTCINCHQGVVDSGSGLVKDISLGLEYAQLDHDIYYASSGRRANQIETLQHIGLLDATPANNQFPSLVDPLAPGQAAEAAARSYLHANCSYCHQPGGGTASEMNLLISASFKESNTCNQLASDTNRWGTQIKLITPQNPGASLIALRMKDTAGDRMPNQGTSLVDDGATSVIDSWISQLTGCP